ncbi:hypothetical protein [Mycobacterium asiaticum]|uniref:Low molecular weight antigen MTB12-like C-terminal domain-containing protein n=1 Tax=Mycobacterium asiaticum TaxID=1790 RepID=A0A1A3D045_MYCAS|nr:hypothetical protein [Mycobacterium asiaticum]OBI92405.1 hypothetical protein A9X01_09625 [Mycobacterium asiaticum]
MTTVRTFTIGAAALACIGVAAVGVSSGATDLAPAVRLVAFGAPLPQDPAPPAPAEQLPTAEQLSSLLTNLADPGVSYRTKEGLVEGGIGSGEGHVVDHELRKAYRNGELPLSFAVSNIAPAGPNRASADVAVSGPKLPAPVTKNLTFVNQGGWMLSADSESALVQAVSGQ